MAVAAAPAPELIPGAATCPACSAILPGAPPFCPDCGAEVATGKKAAVERRLATRELAKAKDSVRAVRGLYWCGAAMTAGIGALLVGAGLQARPGAALHVTYWMVLAVNALLLGAYVAALLRITREPFRWSVLLAAADSVGAALWLLNLAVAGPGLGSLPGVLYGVILIRLLVTAALWSSVVRIARVRPLIEQYPEFWFKAGEARATARTLAIAASVLVLAGAAWWIQGAIRERAAIARQERFPASIGEFRAAWNQSRHEAVAELCVAERRDAILDWLKKRTKNRDWTTSLPALDEGSTIVDGEERKRAAFDCANGSLSVEWRLEDGDWRIHTLRLE